MIYQAFKTLNVPDTNINNVLKSYINCALAHLKLLILIFNIFYSISYFEKLKL